MRETGRDYVCHWDYIPGARWHSTKLGALVWVCEYPFRTTRLSGPDESCDGCPYWEQEKARQIARRSADLPGDRPRAWWGPEPPPGRRG